jgi:tetratricopeptide (TPR) repeat protein
MLVRKQEQISSGKDCDHQHGAAQQQYNIIQKQQRRNSTGYYDPRMTPSFVSTEHASNRTTKSVTSPHPMMQSRRSSINCAEIIAVPPSSPIRSSTRVYTPLSSPVKGNQNEYLTNNKVFQKRYNTAATNIQRVYRGHMYRYEVARIVSAVRIQIFIRAYLQQRKERMYAAAMSIQKIFRGYATRLRSKLYQLEYKLCQIQQCHARELQDIQHRKEVELQSINEMIGQEHIKYMEEKQKLQQTIDDATRIIKHLRKENKKIRDKNETLRVAIDQLIEENEMLERQAEEYKAFAANLDQMKVLNNENVALISIIEQFEQRKQQFEEAIEKRDEFIMYENQMGRLYLHQIQEIVALVEETCTDPYLVAYIEELCIKCNLPGTGLEAEDAIDISERKYDVM